MVKFDNYYQSCDYVSCELTAINIYSIAINVYSRGYSLGLPPLCEYPRE